MATLGRGAVANPWVEPETATSVVFGDDVEDDDEDDQNDEDDGFRNVLNFTEMRKP